MTSYLLRAQDIEADMQEFSHPWNPNSLVKGNMLAKKTGLSRTGVSFVTVPPGKESFIYHSHQTEEEWVYIILGHGIAEIDDQEYEVGAGDFMGFPTPSVAHHLRNTSDKDLVYLMGGESRGMEVADFPRLGRRMIRCGDQIEIYDRGQAQKFEPDYYVK